MRALAAMVCGAASALMVPATAEACTTSGFQRFTNVELVAHAPRVLVATARRTVGEEVEFEVAEVIKGRGVTPGDRLLVDGFLMSGREASLPGDFSRSRPDHGGCNAGGYAAGTSYLLLLEPRGNRWSTLQEPFARVNEEADPIWLRAVREYARAGAIRNAAKRRAALRRLVARGKRRYSSPVDRIIASDVALHLATPTPSKSFRELEPMYARNRGSQALMSIAAGADPAARGFMRRLIRQARRAPSLEARRLIFAALTGYFMHVKPEPRTIEEIGELCLSLAPDEREARWPLMWVLIKHAGKRHSKLMRRALASADDEEAGRLATWFARYRTREAIEELRSRIRTSYADHDDLALGLAAMGDPEVVEWAGRMLSRPPDDARELALYVLAVSPRPEADELAGKVIRGGGDALIPFIFAHREAQHARAAERLKEMEQLPLNDGQRSAIEQTIAARAMR